MNKQASLVKYNKTKIEKLKERKKTEKKHCFSKNLHVLTSKLKKCDHKPVQKRFLIGTFSTKFTYCEKIGSKSKVLIPLGNLKIVFHFRN